MREGGEDINLGGVLTEEFDGTDAVDVEVVVDVAGEVEADGGGRDGDSGGPLFDELFDVGEAVIAGGVEVFGELAGSKVVQGFGAHGPDGGDPGEVGSGVPLMGEVEPLAGADSFFDDFARFEGEKGGVADEDGSVGVLQHRDGVGRGGKESGISVEKFAEEDLGVGQGAAGGGVGCDGFDGSESVRGFDYELDGADFIERCDGAAGDDSKIWRQGSDGDEAEIGAGGEDLVGAEGGLGVVEGVSFGECGG